MFRKLLPFLAVGLLFAGVGTLEAKDGCCKSKAAVAENCDSKKECDKTKCDGDKKSSEDVQFSVIERDQLREMIADGSIMVFDARDEKAYSAGHVDNAVLLASAELPEDKGAAIAFYCGGPKCALAPKAARAAIADGYTNVWVYSGGWMEWSEQAQL